LDVKENYLKNGIWFTTCAKILNSTQYLFNVIVKVYPFRVTQNK